MKVERRSARPAHRLTSSEGRGRFRSAFASVGVRKREACKRSVFVLFPIEKDEYHEDVYYLGIRSAVLKTGYECVRVDEVEHESEILDEILRRIDEAAVIIADTTDGNPNVCYEVGRAHAMGKQVILIAERGSVIPFDLRGKKHIFYSSIRDLEDKLARRLAAKE
jgi:hypothetical protein